MRKKPMQEDEGGNEDLTDTSEGGAEDATAPSASGAGHDARVPRISKHPLSSLVVSGRGSRGQR